MFKYGVGKTLWTNSVAKPLLASTYYKILENVKKQIVLKFNYYNIDLIKWKKYSTPAILKML